MTRTLVAGIGNIFLGDDGFGVEVAQRLSREHLPEGVEVFDVGIRSVHLAFQLLDGYDTLILVDAVQRGDVPGTVSVIERASDTVDDATAARAGLLGAHDLDPVALLGAINALGGAAKRTLIVGCEAADVGDGIGLSPSVRTAVDEAVTVVRRLVNFDSEHASTGPKEKS